MKTLLKALGAVILVATLSSCELVRLKEKYASNEAAAQAFLSDKAGAPATNIEGLWYSPEWGIVLFNQDSKGNLTGIFSNHLHVKGVVNGRSAYLVLTDDAWHEYTVQLRRKSREVLAGYYSSSIPFNPADQHALTLVRIDL